MSERSALVAQMTLEEKAALCTGDSAWTTTAVERIGLPAMLLSDGPHGVRRVADIHSIGAQSLPATCFPTAAALASTWNTELLHSMGQALATEAIALHADVLLGPGINIKRSPLGGRNFEYFSEDPFLAGEMATGLISGIQSRGVGVSLKHFAANNQEFERFSINAQVDERTLHELYLPAFETVVKRAQPWTIMCAYNKLNGTYCSENHMLLTQILREQWGFAGIVVSDWGAVHDRVAALRAGLDLEMPGPRPRRVQSVVDAVRAGTLDESILDASVARILRVVQMAAETSKGGTFDASAHHELARKVAAESMVLLTNNGILPLAQPATLAIIGRSAQTPHFQGGGSSHINPTQVAIPFAEIQRASPESELRYAEGYPADDSLVPALIDEAVTLAQQSDTTILFIALPSFKESEGYDRSDLELTRQQVALIKAVTSVQPNTVVVLNSGSPVAMSEWIDGTAAVLQAWMMGQAGGAAIADLLFGLENPSGKLAETFPLRLADTPAFLHWPGGHGEVRYGEELFVGYRSYDAKELPTLFPFGHGLSYTIFAYGNLSLSRSDFRDVDGLVVSVDVTNTGNVAGKEIVQLYVRDLQAELVRPVKELKGFAKVLLEPGETKRMTFALDFRSFAYYHPAYGRWITEDGEFEILVGASAEDIRCRETVMLRSSLELPCILDRESTVRAWMADKRGHAVLAPQFAELIQHTAAALGGGSDGENAIGMDLTTFFLDMPLLSTLQFGEAGLPAPAEDIVDDLLRQVYATD